jgi:hypothetical protein
MNIEQLTINVNLHCLHPGFLNSELYYIIASSENVFRFAAWDELPAAGESKFYCLLQEKELHIPAGDVVLRESYVLSQHPPFPVLEKAEDFSPLIQSLQQQGVAKGIRCFEGDQVDIIRHHLEKEFGAAEKHLVTSPEAQHQLIVINDFEISISTNMVYFRLRVPVTEEHYRHIKDEKETT